LHLWESKSGRYIVANDAWNISQNQNKSLHVKNLNVNAILAEIIDLRDITHRKDNALRPLVYHRVWSVTGFLKRGPQPALGGLGQFGADVSATGRFGDGGRKCVMRKKCVFLKYFKG